MTGKASILDTIPIPPRSRPLWRRRADTTEGNRIIAEACRLARHPDYAHLSDGELLRLAYWGASGEPDLQGREALRNLTIGTRMVIE